MKTPRLLWVHAFISVIGCRTVFQIIPTEITSHRKHGDVMARLHRQDWGCRRLEYRFQSGLGL
ncbi:hypothetical protein K445DRAFT_319817 [Daldinia sp. EC12]|nr:hypothetical protein K445DRAFT_319817 [Daldinia sp. EC12]